LLVSPIDPGAYVIRTYLLLLAGAADENELPNWPWDASPETRGGIMMS